MSVPAVVTGEPAVVAGEPNVAPLVTDTPVALQAPTPTHWIFSAPIDLAAFALPALVALTLIAWLAPERARDESPTWVWITGVLLVDVAHVWSTAFITYLDPTELRRHPERYCLVPGLAWVAGVLLYGTGGAGLFWRVLAYVAVFHFVRQQYGWMALYRARARDRGRVGGWIDGAAIYAATLYPLLWWHTHLPRRFAWFVDGDFLAGLPRGVIGVAAVVYVMSLGAYGVRAVLQAVRGDLIPWGKHLLLAATAVTWYVGIVATDDDVAFTLTNVLAHGVPYAVLVFSYARFTRQGEGERDGGVASRVFAGKPGPALMRLLACVWLLAYVEELLWDRSVWHERPELFGGGGLDVFSGFEAWLVPLLALPQVSHYVLDGFFWRRGGNPRVGEWLRRGG